MLLRVMTLDILQCLHATNERYKSGSSLFPRLIQLQCFYHETQERRKLPNNNELGLLLLLTQQDCVSFDQQNTKLWGTTKKSATPPHKLELRSQKTKYNPNNLEQQTQQKTQEITPRPETTKFSRGLLKCPEKAQHSAKSASTATDSPCLERERIRQITRTVTPITKKSRSTA